MDHTYENFACVSHETTGHPFEHKPLYEKNMEYIYYTPTDEEEEMIEQYLRDTDAEYRESNRANIYESVEKFNRGLIEKYGAENLSPEDFLVISDEQYLIGEFDDCFHECREKIEKKFGMPYRAYSFVEQTLPKEVEKKTCEISECETSLIILNDALRDMLFSSNYSERISSFLAGNDQSHHLNEAETTTIYCSNDATFEQYNPSGVAPINDSDLSSTTNEVTYPQDNTNNSRAIDKIITNNSPCDGDFLSEIISLQDDISLVYNNDTRLDYKDPYGLKHIHGGLEYNYSSDNEKTRSHYYFKKMVSSKAISIYSTIPSFTTRQLTMQITLGFVRPEGTSDIPSSLIDINQHEIFRIPWTHMGIQSLTSTLEWICFRWKHRRKINENIMTRLKSLVARILECQSILVSSRLYNSLFHRIYPTISYSLESKTRIFPYLRCFLLRQKFFLNLVESGLKETMHHARFSISWWINNR